MSIQRRSDELVDLLRPDFVGNDGTASPTFTDEYLTGSHRQSISVGVRVYRNVNQLIGTGAATAISFTHQRWDDPDDDQWVIGTPTRLTCQFDGIYVVSGSIAWVNNIVGLRQVYIYLNGVTSIAIQTELSITNNYFYQGVTTTYKLSVGDFVELLVFQDSGGNLNLWSSAQTSPEFSMVRVA